MDINPQKAKLPWVTCCNFCHTQQTKALYMFYEEHILDLLAESQCMTCFHPFDLLQFSIDHIYVLFTFTQCASYTDDNAECYYSSKTKPKS